MSEHAGKRELSQHKVRSELKKDEGKKREKKERNGERVDDSCVEQQSMEEKEGSDSKKEPLPPVFAL